MSFLGKTYVLESQSNYDGFVNSFGQNLSEDKRQALLNHKSTVQLTQNGDSYKLITSQPTGQKEITFKSGVEFAEDVMGTQAQTTLTLDGSTLTQVQKFDQGTITHKREFSADQMEATITTSLWDGPATRFYKAA